LLILGSVTLVKSNAKALLTGKPRCGFLEKASCTLQKLYCVTVCVDSDGDFATA